jgi:hypothetical protein
VYGPRWVRELQNIRRTSSELANPDGGTLSIATTHTRFGYSECISSVRKPHHLGRLSARFGTSCLYVRFCELLAPHLPKKFVRKAERLKTQEECGKSDIQGQSRLATLPRKQWIYKYIVSIAAPPGTNFYNSHSMSERHPRHHPKLSCRVMTIDAAPTVARISVIGSRPPGRFLRA